MQGDVARDGDQDGLGPAGVREPHRVTLHPAARTLEPDDFELQLGRVAGEYPRGHVLERLPVLRNDDPRYGVGQFLDAGSVQHHQSGGIHLDDGAIGSDDLETFR